MQPGQGACGPTSRRDLSRCVGDTLDLDESLGSPPIDLESGIGLQFEIGQGGHIANSVGIYTESNVSVNGTTSWRPSIPDMTGWRLMALSIFSNPTPVGFDCRLYIDTEPTSGAPVSISRYVTTAASELFYLQDMNIRPMELFLKWPWVPMLEFRNGGGGDQVNISLVLQEVPAGSEIPK